MKETDINKGLVVYHDSFGLLVVDGMLPDGRVSCNDGHVITYPHLLDKVDQDMLDDRGVTKEAMAARNAHI